MLVYDFDRPCATQRKKKNMLLRRKKRDKAEEVVAVKAESFPDYDEKEEGQEKLLKCNDWYEIYDRAGVSDLRA